MDNNGQQQTNHNHVLHFAHDGDYVNDIDEIIAGSYNNNERDSIYLDPDTILRLTRSRTSGGTTAYNSGGNTTRSTPSSDTITRDTTASTFASSTLTATPSADGGFVSGGVEKKKKTKKSIPGAYPSHHLASQEKLLRNSAPTQNFGGGSGPTTTATATDIDNDRAIQLEKQMILQLTSAYTNDSATTPSIMTPGTLGPRTIRGESSIPASSPSSRLSSRRPSSGLTSRLSSVRFSSANNNDHHKHHQSNHQERHQRAPVLEDYESGVIIEPPPVHFAGGGGQFSEEPEVEEPSAFSINFQITHKRQEGCERGEIPPLSSEATTRVEYLQPNNNHNPTVSSPETDSCISTFRRSKVAKFVALMCCLISVGLIISLIVVFVKDSNNEDIIPSQKISTNLDLLVGDPLDGISELGMFGSSISMNRGGTRMAVADSNNVFVYELTYFDWVLVTKIEGRDEESSHDGGEPSQNELIRSTIQVDMSSDGNTIAIGRPYSTNKDGLEPGTGRVEVYQEEEHYSGNTGWEKMGNTLYGQIGKEFFGTSVALNEDGTQIAIGSSGMDGSGGSAAIYTLLNQGLWLKKGDTLHLSGNRPITSVAFKGYTLAIAGLQSTTITTYGQGPVSHVYRFGSFNWVELGNGLMGNRAATETTAYLVDMSSSGNIVALSDYYVSNREHGDDGLGIRVYAWDGRDWIQMGENVFAPGKKSGYFISMSDDGKLLGMGHPGRPSEEEGDSVAGHIHAYIFDNTSQLWEQIGPNYEGEDPGDHFGGAVAMSGDGKYFAAGARNNGGTGIELGRVYVLDVRNIAGVVSYGD